MNERTPLIFDCETSDPDDMLTLLSLCDHPRINLKAITITPGSKAQYRLARMLLDKMGRDDVPIGVHDINWPKDCVSEWHYQAFGRPSESDEIHVLPAFQVLAEQGGPETTLLTGASLRNLGTALSRDPQLRLKRWVAQGGFAGANLVPEEDQLEKFKGKITCATYNFNGDPKAALRALATPTILEKRLVSKNVCHGVAMSPALRDRMHDAGQIRGRRSIALIAQHCPPGKMLHDLVALAAVLHPEIFKWEPVEMYREKGEWGANPCRGSSTWISVKLDHDAFTSFMTES